MSLVSDVANRFLRLRELDERIVLAQETIKKREQSFHVITRRLDAGTTTRLDGTQEETLLTQLAEGHA